MEEELIRIGIRETSQFFEDMFLQKRIDGKIPVLVEEFMTSFFFVICDKQGYPMRKYTDYLTFLENPFLVTEGKEEETFMKETKVYKKTVRIERPLIYRQFGRPDFFDKPYFFLWEGKIVDKQEIPVEQLDIKQLLKLAQASIKNREGLIIDEVLKNQLLK